MSLLILETGEGGRDIDDCLLFTPNRELNARPLRAPARASLSLLKPLLAEIRADGDEEPFKSEGCEDKHGGPAPTCPLGCRCLAHHTLLVPCHPFPFEVEELKGLSGCGVAGPHQPGEGTGPCLAPKARPALRLLAELVRGGRWLGALSEGLQSQPATWLWPPREPYPSGSEPCLMPALWIWDMEGGPRESSGPTVLGLGGPHRWTLGPLLATRLPCTPTCPQAQCSE